MSVNATVIGLRSGMARGGIKKGFDHGLKIKALTVALSDNVVKLSNQGVPPVPLSWNSNGVKLLSEYQKRFFSDVSKPVSKSSSKPEPPALPNWREFEKCLLRTIAFMWDIIVWLYLYGKYVFTIYIIENPTVKMYVKKFTEKIENSRKD